MPWCMPPLTALFLLHVGTDSSERGREADPTEARLPTRLQPPVMRDGVPDAKATCLW